MDSTNLQTRDLQDPCARQTPLASAIICWIEEHLEIEIFEELILKGTIVCVIPLDFKLNFSLLDQDVTCQFLRDASVLYPFMLCQLPANQNDAQVEFTHDR